MYEEKLAILAKLNEDLREFNPDYEETKKLISQNQEKLLESEEEINVQKEWNLMRLEMKLEERKKARLIDSRWLSDGSLECQFIDKEWESFTRLYNEDDFFSRRQKEREEKMAAINHNAEEEFRRFGYLFPTGVKREKKEKLEAIYW